MKKQLFIFLINSKSQIKVCIAKKKPKSLGFFICIATQLWGLFIIFVDTLCHGNNGRCHVQNADLTLEGDFCITFSVILQ